MVEQTDFFDQRHHQPPPVIPIRDGLATPSRPASPPPNPQPVPQGEAARWSPQQPIQQVTPQYIQMARAVSQILATRVLLLIAVVTAAVDWSYVVYAPTELRIVAGAVFSVLLGWPLVWLYFRKG